MDTIALRPDADRVFAENLALDLALLNARVETRATRDWTEYIRLLDADLEYLLE